ncbi:hypothetical protein VTI28DRAFT_7855 [Corynascus sepedonium]
MHALGASIAQIHLKWLQEQGEILRLEPQVGFNGWLLLVSIALGPSVPHGLPNVVEIPVTPTGMSHEPADRALPITQMPLLRWRRGSARFVAEIASASDPSCSRSSRALGRYLGRGKPHRILVSSSLAFRVETAGRSGQESDLLIDSSHGETRPTKATTAVILNKIRTDEQK